MTKSNEPAFPMVDKYGRPAVNLDSHVAREQFGAGLTKREYFAGLAMQGLLATHANLVHNPIHVAHWAVKNADALIAELAKGGEA